MFYKTINSEFMVTRISILLLFLPVILCTCKKNTPLSPTEPHEVEHNEILGFDTQNQIFLQNGPTTEVLKHIMKLGIDTSGSVINRNPIAIGREYPIVHNGQSVSLFRTELPILFISTNDLSIPDEPKIPGTLVIKENGKETDSFTIGIELRGGTSQRFPKKSYNFEIWEDEQGSDTQKISLLNMREDDDWLLDGMWNEPNRIRDYTAMELWIAMARKPDLNRNTDMGISRRYCEVFLNNSYIGVYYLGEKIDRKQLDLKKFDDTLEGELYKGDSWAPGVTFLRAEPYDNTSVTWSGYEAKYPDEIGQLDWSNLHSLVEFVSKSSKSKFTSEISSMVDLNNMVDYYIFLNLIYAQDNTGKNTYLAKIDSDSPYFYIPWDMDGSFGNNWEGNRIDITDKLLSNRLFDNLMTYPDFTQSVKQRWIGLRESLFSTDALIERFRKNYDLLLRNNVYAREDIVPDIAQNHTKEEIYFIESWIERRANFLDTYFSRL